MVLLGPGTSPDDALGAELELRHAVAAVDGTPPTAIGANILSLIDRDPMPERGTPAWVEHQRMLLDAAIELSTSLHRLPGADRAYAERVVRMARRALASR